MTLDDVYEDLLLIVSRVGAQVDVPLESEEYFRQVVENFQGERQQLLAYISSNISTWFRSMQSPPAWIHEAEWQFYDGKPMKFVGQINVPAATTEFHDDASFYVFYSPESGVTKTVIQVA